jgi:hypothetical protein
MVMMKKITATLCYEFSTVSKKSCRAIFWEIKTACYAYMSLERSCPSRTVLHDILDILTIECVHAYSSLVPNPYLLV